MAQPAGAFELEAKLREQDVVRGLRVIGDWFKKVGVSAKDLGIEVREKRITRDELYCADEAFFSGTAAEITPIREVDDRRIGEGRRGPVTEKLQTLFFDIVAGRNPKYAGWLAPV